MPELSFETATESGHQVEVSHPEFCAGLPAGRFRLIVNPEKAQKYIKHRLFIVGIALPIIGLGTALSWSGYTWAGLPLIAIGFLLPRVVKAHAPKILLFLAMREARTYHDALEFEIMEIRLR
ncbi:MAG: hypothetical protein Q7U05_10545 [Polaromonas sp.]|jgi:hypothetical protein|nr:hypothetical protein [Polaromonas sp.]